ncbi:hypothetical protein SDC9_197807 [bioreactor metagenome]|uniref:Uncharacterized protein n=1 Tax=bioreactor metagenome TaxID=1076179 RepID=A0A645IFT7_9ZZZZ
MSDPGLPIGIRVDVLKMVMIWMLNVTQHALRIDRCLIDRVGTGLIQRYRIKGSEHSDIIDDCRIIFAVTVTIR